MLKMTQPFKSHSSKFLRAIYRVLGKEDVEAQLQPQQTIRTRISKKYKKSLCGSNLLLIANGSSGNWKMLCGIWEKNIYIIYTFIPYCTTDRRPNLESGSVSRGGSSSLFYLESGSPPKKVPEASWPIIKISLHRRIQHLFYILPRSRSSQRFQRIILPWIQISLLRSASSCSLTWNPDQSPEVGLVASFTWNPDQSPEEGLAASFTLNQISLLRRV